MNRIAPLLLALLLVGCTAPAETTSTSSGDPGCSQYLDAQTACVEVTHHLEGYGCTFSGACNAACPSGSAVCSDSVTLCEQAAADELVGSSDIAAACLRVESYCNSALSCDHL